MHANNIGMSELMLQKRPFKNKTGLGTIAHQSMVRDFSGACQLQILSGLDGARDQPQAVWDPLHQVHHGGRGRVWSCHLNPQPAAASAAGAQPWSWPAEETRQKNKGHRLEEGSEETTKELVIRWCVPVEGQPAAAHSVWTSSGFAVAAVAAVVVAAAAAAGEGADKPERRQTEKEKEKVGVRQQHWKEKKNSAQWFSILYWQTNVISTERYVQPGFQKSGDAVKK